MRRSSHRWAIVLLAFSSGVASAQSDGNGSAGGQQASAGGQTDRQLSRQMRRQHRLSQLNALRISRGLNARGHSDSAIPRGPAVAAERGLDAVERPAWCPGPGDVKPPVLLGPPIRLDPSEAAAQGQVAIWEGLPNENGEYENGEWDWQCHPRIYTLNNLGEGPLPLRGSDGGEELARPGNGGGLSSRIPLVGQLLDRSNGRDRTDEPADVVPGRRALADHNVDSVSPSRILAGRLAEIDRLRDAALANGNLDLLDRADQLEKLARSRHVD